MNRTVVVIAVVATASAALADPGYQSKKDRDRAAKTKSTTALPKVGVKPDKLVNLFNTWTDERLAVARGEQVAPEQLSRFFRDHYTNEQTNVEPRLLKIVMSAAQKFRSDSVMVVSSFRHPKYNLILRKKGHQVARDSAHSHGDAVDFFIPRVATKKLHEWAVAQKVGGVGLYLDSGFVHMDTGKVRYWNGE